jgi:hypothetical protein
LFMDSPEPGEIKEAIKSWSLPDWPAKLERLISEPEQGGFGEISQVVRDKLSSTGERRKTGKLEKAVISWLYPFIRLNVKRGPVFDLRQVLRTGSADCLGYGKLFVTLGRQCGLETGIVEVIVDNRGRYVPHTVVLVKLVGNKPCFIDFWYGSTDIRHKRLGLQVNRDGRWQVEDLDFREVPEAEDVSCLPDTCVDAITCFILGNRALKGGDFSRAIIAYSEAIRLYPGNARPYYNRALAYENLHQLENAQSDYARAMQNEASLMRILAAQPEDVVGLMQLDQRFIPELDQQIYLMYAGFFSGRKMSPLLISEKLDIPVEEVEAVLELLKELI